MESYSQDKQDIFIYEKYFKDRKTGYFVEIGINDGITISNSLLFEKLGWRGIGIEPILETYNKLIKNRNCECVNGVISDSNDFEVDFLEINGYSEMLSGIYREYNPQHLERVNRELKQFGGEKNIIKVKNYNFNNIIKEFNIDILFIDTEGNELKILKSIDFNIFNIDVICVENNFNDKNLIDFMISKGYEYIINLGADNIFKKI